MRVKTIIKRILIGIAIFVIAMWVIGFILIKTGYEPPAKPDPVAEQSETANKSVQAPEPEPQAPQPVEPQAVQPVVVEPQQQASQTQPENLLMKAKIQEAPVANGFGEKIGTRAYITIPQEVLLEVVTFEDCGEFYRSFQGKNYNWVSIVCPEGTGLVFPGAGPLASYGKLDRDGRLTEDIHWTITYDESTGAFKEFERDTRFLPKGR